MDGTGYVRECLVCMEPVFSNGPFSSPVAICDRCRKAVLLVRERAEVFETLSRIPVRKAEAKDDGVRVVPL